MIITKQDGTPFATENVAKSCATRKGLENYKIVEVEGGWAVEILDVKEEPIISIKEPEKSNVQIMKEGRPTNILEIPEEYKPAGRRYRWMIRSLESVEKRLAQGWTIDRDVSKKRASIYGTAKTQDDRDFRDKTQSLGTETHLREFILMWLPEEQAIKRNQHYRNKAMQ
jgi:hypothetical protein